MSDTMNAAVWTATGIIETRCVPRPKPADGETLIKIESTGICGTDIAILTGKHPRARAPLIMGHEAGGVVAEIHGEKPDGVDIGTRVTFFPLISCGICHTCRTGKTYICENLKLIGIDSDGADAEYTVVPSSHVIPVPQDWNPYLAALTEPVAVAVHSVRRSSIKPGDSVLILGAGIIGNLCAQMASAAGATTVAITDISQFRVNLAQECGLIAINQNTEDIIARTGELTGGVGFDVIMECSGAASAQPAAIASARVQGEIVIIGMPKEPPPVDLRTVAFKELFMTGCRVYERRDFVRAIDMVEQGRISVDRLVTHTFPVEQAAVAFNLMKTAGDSLKILLTF